MHILGIIFCEIRRLNDYPNCARLRAEWVNRFALNHFADLAATAISGSS